MDAINRKIVRELVVDSRASLTSIGKKVRLSRENVDYRIKQLQKKGIIKDFIAVVDHDSLGLSHFAVFCADTTPPRQASWIGMVAGRWSLTFDIFSRSPEEVEKITAPLSDERLVLQVKGKEYMFGKMVGVLPKRPSEGRGTVDDKDRKIIRILASDARARYTEIAESVGMTPNGVKARVKHLERSSIIQGYTVTLDHHKLGFDWYGIQLRTHDTRAREYFHTHPKVIFYYEYFLGSHDFDVGVVVRNSQELRDFLIGLRKDLDVGIVDVFSVLEERTGMVGII